MRVTIAASITPDGAITAHSLSRRPASSSPTAAASTQGSHDHQPSLECHAPAVARHPIGRSTLLSPTKPTLRTPGLANAKRRSWPKAGAADCLCDGGGAPARQGPRRKA